MKEVLLRCSHQHFPSFLKHRAGMERRPHFQERGVLPLTLIEHRIP